MSATLSNSTFDTVCEKCGNKYNWYHTYSTKGRAHKKICSVCSVKDAQALIETILDNKASTKTLEERIRDIERWILEHKQVEHGYVSPPRF